MSSIHLVRSPHTCLKHFISDYNPSRDLDVARDCGTNLHQQICWKDVYGDLDQSSILSDDRKFED